jgi:hypothetical protein
MGDPWVRVYGLVDGNEMELYKGHHGPVHAVMYSPDGEMYASGSGESPFQNKFVATPYSWIHRGRYHSVVANYARQNVRIMARSG